MLQLPDNWHQCSTAHVVTSLLRQAQTISQYPAAARAIVKAAIDFMLTGPRWDKYRSTIRLVRTNHGWKLNDWRFHILTDTNDDSFGTLAHLPRKSDGSIDVITPPWSKNLLERGANAEYPHRCFDMIGIDHFCDYRLLWTRLDLSQDRITSIGNLLQRYRHLTRQNTDITLPEIAPPRPHLCLSAS